jgi:hypothetical protein
MLPDKKLLQSKLNELYSENARAGRDQKHGGGKESVAFS